MTDRHVVVVGAGFAGLSAACRLRSAGHEVTVVERRPTPGGWAGSVVHDGYRFDAGPTVLPRKLGVAVRELSRR